MRSIIVLLALACLLSGSDPIRSKYQNHIVGISLDKPKNWVVKIPKRLYVIILEPQNSYWEENLTVVTISELFCNDSATGNTSSIEEISHDIDRIRSVHHADAVTFIEEPRTVMSAGNEVTKAVIRVPKFTQSEESRASINNVNNTGELQTIDIFLIRSSDQNSIMAYIYESSNEELNAQAQAIVNSIQRNCPGEP